VILNPSHYHHVRVYLPRGTDSAIGTPIAMDNRAILISDGIAVGIFLAVRAVGAIGGAVLGLCMTLPVEHGDKLATCHALDKQSIVK